MSRALRVRHSPGGLAAILDECQSVKPATDDPPYPLLAADAGNTQRMLHKLRLAPGLAAEAPITNAPFTNTPSRFRQARGVQPFRRALSRARTEIGREGPKAYLTRRSNG
jgi:hypothetical protein